MSDVTSTPSRPASPTVSVLAANDLPTARPYRFVWDPSSRRPGPESVAGTTEGGRGGADYITGNTQYPLGVLNNPSSLNLALGVLPAEWSSAKHGFHAISTVLNNPHKKQAPPKPHSSLPSVPPADLPRVRRKDFDSYLNAVRPEWEKFEHNVQLGKGGQAQIDSARFGGDFAEAEDDDFDEHPQRIPRSRSASLALQGAQIPPLDSVPSVFFEATFHLGDPKTFDLVTEQDSLRTFDSMDNESDVDPLSLSHSPPLLEKFDRYADIVEQHLIREIGIRSSSFFAALTNLRDLQESSKTCLNRIQDLREKLKQIDEGTAKKGLELVRAKRKENRVKEVAEGVKSIQGVIEMIGVAKGLVNAGQWGEALEVVEGIEGMWEEEAEDKEKLSNGTMNGTHKLESTPEEDEEDETKSPPNGDDQHAKSNSTPASSQHSRPTVLLSSLAAFSSLPSHLRQLTLGIAASLASELVSILKDDWLSYVEAKEDATEQQEGGEQRNQGLKDRLKPLLLNLLRTKGLKEGVLSWREVALSEVKGLVKKKLPDVDLEADGDRPDENGEIRPNFAGQLRNLSQEDFMKLMSGVYQSLLNGIERLKTQGDIISEVLAALKPELQTRLASRNSSTAKKSKSISIPDVDEDLADILSSSCEVANVQAAKAVSCRSELHAQLELPEFYLFFNESWSFVLRCEVLCRRMIVGLRGTVVSQAKLWLQTFHQARLTSSGKLVEDEVWSPAEVSQDVQRIATIIVDSAVKDSAELIISQKKEEEAKDEDGTTSTPDTHADATPDSATNPVPPPTASTPATANGPRSKQLRIEDRSYFIVPATAGVLKLLPDYLKVIVNLPMLTTDTMSRVIEFLKVFNSKTCQVVLGAGAMRSAGLKFISARHLALASQSLSIIYELIPYVRETFRRHLNQKQAVMLVEFDKLKRDYQEHQNEIHTKLVTIMGDRLSSHIESLRSIDWKASEEQTKVNDYMLALVKETVQLHKILVRYLPIPIMEFVMSQVLAAINHRLSEEYTRIELPNQLAKNRMLEDAKYLHQNFSTLRHIRGAPTGMLETVVAEKSLPRPSNAPVTPNRSNTLTANQRLKGLLTGKGSSFADKALPNPGQTSSSPPPVPPADVRSTSSEIRRSTSPAPMTGVTSNGTDGSLGISTVSLAMSPPIEENGTSRFGPMEGSLPNAKNTEPTQP